jgi:formylglycine-generating enzyme required for sulfatase activity
MSENSKETGKVTRIDMKDSKAGIVGDGATVHGGIHTITIENLTVYRTRDDETAEKAPEKKKTDIGPNPYISLNAFQERDSDRFFGREKLTAKLWQKLRALIEPGVEADKIRLLPILGPSGSGKSSVARAGLISELARKPLPGYKKARVAVFTPGNMPVYAMAGVLASMLTGEVSPLAKADEFNEGLKKQNDKGEFDGLTRIAHIFPDIHFSPLIILVDQFEEIYASRCEVDERNCFIDNLLHAASDAAGYVSVIITLRSDFLGETQAHKALNRAIAENGEIVSVMDTDELRRAIAKPAEKAGHPLDPLVIDMLIEQTKDREGALPLLQFALTQIWEGMADGELPTERLKKIGGVGGAVAKEAHRLFSKLKSQEQSIVRRAFLAMVNLGEGVKDTRRRVRLENLIGGAEEPSQVKKVLKTFSNRSARLVTFSGSKSEDSTISVEITHEILLEQWMDLKDWLSCGREDLRLQRRLEQASEHWKNENKPSGLLWRSPDLDLARKLYENQKDDFTALQKEFFLASRRASNRRFIFSIVLTALIVLGVVVAFIIINKEKRVALENEKKANYHLALIYEEKAGIALKAALAGDKPEENFQKAWLYTLAALNLNIPVDKDLPLSEERLGMKEMHLGLLLGTSIASDQRYQGFATKDKTVRQWESDLPQAYKNSGKRSPEFQAVYRCSKDLFPYRMDGISLVPATRNASEITPWYADYPRPDRKDPIQWMIEAFAKAIHDGKISSDGIPTAWVNSYANTILENAEIEPEHKPFPNDIGMTFIYIEPGAFFMGSPLEESGRDPDETFHMVTLDKGFYMQTTEVTQGQWEAVMGKNPSYFNKCGPNCPVENVTWNDIQSFIEKLNEMENENYDLPSEAQWEYACRAGSTTRYCYGDQESQLAEYAWYDKNSERSTHPVPRLKANAWGLYDMHGNVWEWCEDHWHDNYKGAPVDGSAWVDRDGGAFRVLRGGSWGDVAGYCRTAFRVRSGPGYRFDSLGFRLVCLPGQRGEPSGSGKDAECGSD